MVVYDTLSVEENSVLLLSVEILLYGYYFNFYFYCCNKCGEASVGPGFKKENITVVVGFNFDSAAKLVLAQCGEAGVGTGFKKENVAVVMLVDFESGVKRLLVQV
ncbi:hypothetical protein F4703DRAFT_1919374 [Phycomyces blakesleeanus]